MNATRFARLTLLLLSAVAPAALADESFQLNIPVRGDATQETAEVRVTLGLDNLPGGAQLRVSGTTLTLGSTSFVGGDFVTFEAGTGNQVVIIYRPMSNFGAGFCSGGSAVAKNIPMRFQGAQNVTDYRITSYVVGAPGAECTKASKRVGNLAASIAAVSDGVAPALTASNRGRHPLDVVLVLDRSGSMSGLPPMSGGGASKATILKSAMTAFVSQWEILDAPLGEGEWSGDRLGVVFFDTTGTPQTISGGFFVPRGTDPPGPTHDWKAVRDAIGGLTPSGMTALGDGINDAMQQWSADKKNDLFVLAVTDGMQNMAPRIDDTGTWLKLLPVSSLHEELRKRFIPIQSVGFGVPADVDKDLLDRIGEETSGAAHVAIDATTMYEDLGQDLVSILKGNTVSLALQRSATMAGAGPSAPIPVLVDRSARRVLFSLQWEPPFVNALDLQITPPPPVTGAPLSASDDLPQAALRAYDISPSLLGTWNVRVVRRPNADVAAGTNIPYTLNVFIVEGALTYRLSFRDLDAGTGSMVRVRADIGYDGQPLSGLPPNAVRLRIQRPGEALGTILHDTAADPAAPTPGDPQSPYQQKLDALTDPQLLGRIMPRDHSTISLTDEGNGIYSGTFADTSVPGLYRFEALLEWNDPRTGALRREERLERNINVTPDPRNTRIETSKPTAGTVLVAVTPRDRFGNYLGPGYDRQVVATLNSPGTIATPVPADAQQTGRYVFTITGVPAGQTPDVDIVVDGVPVGGTSGGAGASGPWRFFIDAGLNFPDVQTVDGVFSLNAGIERLFTPNLSVEGILGYHRFERPLIEPDIWQLSANAKYFFMPGPLRPFVNGGVGVYRIDPPDDTEFGWNAGAGLLYQVNAKWGFEAVYNYHATDPIDWSTVQLGLRWHF